MSGWMLPVDKPEGPTSFDAVAAVRRVSGERRVGHTGTLDPFASGLLLILGGAATKLCPYLLDEEKEYEGVLRLGLHTDTGDPTGCVLEERPVPPGLSLDDLRAAATRFVGRIRQAPPAYSAVKVDGERLYRRARRGLAACAPERDVEVRAFEIDEFAPPHARFRVRCGRGTYIRRLAEDLGGRLGCGASLVSLRRTRIGRFRVSDAARLDELSHLRRDEFAGRLHPSGEILAGWPTLVLDAEGARRVRHGQPLERAALTAAPVEGRLALLGPDGLLVAVAEVRADGPIRTLRVF